MQNILEPYPGPIHSRFFIAAYDGDGVPCAWHKADFISPRK